MGKRLYGKLLTQNPAGSTGVAGEPVLIFI